MRRSLPYQVDLLIDELANIGFDTFSEPNPAFEAYISRAKFSELILAEALNNFEEDIDLDFQLENVPSENWNKEWENNFSPMAINNECYIRATFHPVQPQYRYELVIDPKMAFGTGHHETTTMMLEYVLEADIAGKTVLDMGCGTGILGILASMRGAENVVAIDNDELSRDSTVENAAQNQVRNIQAFCGSKEAIPAGRFDVILANINRNILLDQIPVYAGVLAPAGRIFFSGFYDGPDLEMIKEKCAEHSLGFIDHKKQKEWTAAQFMLITN